MKRPSGKPDVSRLPVAKGMWLGARRPFDIIVEDTPGGVDMCVWLDTDAEFVRAGTICPRGEEFDALTQLLMTAMLQPMPGGRPARPQTVAVENPPPSLRTLCRNSGIRLVEKADFSAIDEIVKDAAGDVDDLTESLDYLVDDVTPHHVREFFAAASRFQRAAPWRRVRSHEPVELEGLDKALRVVVQGDGEDDPGAVMCLDDAVLADVLAGKTIEPDGPARPLLYFTWVPADEAGPVVYKQAKQHNWKLREGEPAPLLMTFQRPDPDSMPSAAELRLATDALEALARINFASASSIDINVTVGQRPVHVRWPLAPQKAKNKPTKEAVKALQLRVTLRDTDIWRSVVLPEDFTMHDLHHVIQDAMGWDNSHDWCITRANEEYDDEEGGDVLLSALRLRAGSKLTYIYDFGDDWTHDLVVEKHLTEGDAPACIGGQNACPPEDCGGVPRYLSLLNALTDRQSPLHRDALDALGKEFDSSSFDLKAANRRVRRR